MRAATARAPGAQGLGRAATDGRRRARATRGGAREGARGRGDAVMTSAGGKEPVYLLDYGAGNVRSVRNAVAALGFEVRDVKTPEDLSRANKLIFPGVGAYGSAMDILRERGLIEPLREYVRSDKPFLGVCLGLQLLFDGSEESGGVEGLGLIPGSVGKFRGEGLIVPHIGWNLTNTKKSSGLMDGMESERVYFVHSYRATPSEENKDWVLATCDYGGEFIASVQKGNVMACQFHPEKSGATGLGVFQRFLEDAEPTGQFGTAPSAANGLARRVIACLDVRSNDNGDLVVTKGDSYDVREKDEGGDVRNLGKPVELAGKYFKQGADEVAFLNITGYRDLPLTDAPMLEVLRRSSETVFVPLTVGGGIRDFTDSNGKSYTALEVASAYFASGADKVSIGSDAVYVAEEWYASGKVNTGKTSIEQISERYGVQAVVISIDPRRQYVADPSETKNACIETSRPGPNGEKYVWFQCTVKGGREGRDIGAYELAIAMEALGAGEILLNCIDEDGQGNGFDHELVSLVSDAVGIPVIASSGAGCPEHFTNVFNATKCSAALAAGIFHREEVLVSEVKEHMQTNGLPARA
jgi:glutamine amidotransferase/cyclase|tara:strand:+ start:1771 stop:3519 length:1749 start_codon:yes stop_codon:yes gene_type:complete